MKFWKLSAKFNIENCLIIAGFALSLSFFIIQHFLNTGWDFMVYALNAKYFSGAGNFFEWSRPPLVPFILFVLSYLSFGCMKIAEYLYLILVSLIYLFASIKFADRLNVNRALFYIVSLSPFLLIHGLFEGTELLSLAMIMLFLAYIGEKKAPVFLALACLVRYPNIIFMLLLIFRKDWKKIPRDLGIFFAFIVPWLVFCYIKTGNFMVGYMDSYALVMAFRDYISSPVRLGDFLILGHLAILAFIGLYFIIKEENKKQLGFHLYTMIFVLIVGLMEYYFAKIKVERYLFLLILPLSYFSSIALSKIRLKKLLVSICIILLTFSLAYSFYYSFSSKDKFIKTDTYAQYIKDKSEYIGNCSILSNAHIYLNYAGIQSESFPDARIITKAIREGYRIVLFKAIAEPSYTFNSSFIESLNPIYQDDVAVIIGDINKCSNSLKLDKTYLEKINELYMKVYGIPFKVTFIELFFKYKRA